MHRFLEPKEVAVPLIEDGQANGLNSKLNWLKTKREVPRGDNA